MDLVTEKYHFTEEQIADEEQEIRAAIIDMSRFSVLYDRYYIQLFRYIYHKVESAEDAADITSQVFLKVMVYLRNYQFTGLPFTSWLYGIASNELIKVFKKNKKTRMVYAAPEDLDKIASEMEVDITLERLALLKKALSSLYWDEIELLEMRYFEHRTFAAIGEIKGLTENNSKLKVHRIIQKLKEKIKIEGS